MSTENKKLFNSLKQVEQEVNRIVTAQGIEFKKLQQEFGLLNDYNDQMSAMLAGSWNSGENDREVEEELNRLMAEAKPEQKETELNKGAGKVPTTVEGPIPTVPTMEKLTGGVELKRNSSQDQRLSAAGFSFNENKEFITINLDAQTMIAKSSSEISTDLEEKEQLNELGDRLGMISQVVKNTEISKEDQPRMFKIISKGLEKVYDGIKEGISSTLNGVKKLGGKFVESIKSIFKESPEKQLEKNRETLKGLYENFVGLTVHSKEIKDQFLENHFNQIDKLTTPEEFSKETIKVSQATIRLGKKKLLEIKNKHIENKKALHEKTFERQQRHDFSPSPTPSINKGKLNGLQH